jgi:hypothetical protein
MLLNFLMATLLLTSEQTLRLQRLQNRWIKKNFNLDSRLWSRFENFVLKLVVHKIFRTL